MRSAHREKYEWIFDHKIALFRESHLGRSYYVDENLYCNNLCAIYSNISVSASSFIQC
jgi:hypothetical protein